MPLIVHISDLHISELGFEEDVFIKAVAEINAINPDMIILTGDLTNNGYYSEFIQATKYLEMFDAPLFAVPGNHDARNLGYETFEELIGECSWKLTKDDEFNILVGKLMAEEDSFKKKVIEEMLKLDDEDWIFIEKFVSKIKS